MKYRNTPGAAGAIGATGERGATGKISRAAIAGYIIMAIGTTLGVWFVGHHSSENLKNQINSVVTDLCIGNRPTIMKENKLRDVQISIAQAALDINLKDGDTERAALNNRTIVALRDAKRHVPTIEECKTPLIKD